MDIPTLRNLYKVEVKLTSLKITFTLNYLYLNYPKTNCTMTATKGKLGWGKMGEREEGAREEKELRVGWAGREETDKLMK